MVGGGVTEVVWWVVGNTKMEEVGAEEEYGENDE